MVMPLLEEKRSRTDFHPDQQVRVFRTEDLQEDGSIETQAVQETLPPAQPSWDDEGIEPETIELDFKPRPVQWEEITNERLLRTADEVAEFSRLPMQLIQHYAARTALRGRVEQLEDNSWYADVRNFTGVWSEGDSKDEALNGLYSVVLDWALMKIEDQDRDLPIIDNIDLNIL